MGPSLTWFNRSLRPLVMSLVLSLPPAAPQSVAAAPASSLDLGVRQGYSIAVVGSQLFIAGGSQFVTDPDGAHGRSVDSDEVDVFDGNSGEWSTTHLTVPRDGMSVATVGSQVLFAGGYDPDPQTGTNRSSAAENVYDTATGLLSGGNLSQPRDRMAAAARGDLVLLLDRV